MYLLDTVVLSELRKSRRNPGVVNWIETVVPTDLYLSIVTIAEIERGIERQRKINPGFAVELAKWLDLTIRLYAERILALDIGIARRWGQLSAIIGNNSLDLAIAATALEHGLTVVTRDVGDFERAQVAIFNPFKPSG
jgi:predicted nucleic acid-binding protein